MCLLIRQEWRRSRHVCAAHRQWLEDEREACAALVDAWPEMHKYTDDRATYGVQMATELADAIRARNGR